MNAVAPENPFFFDLPSLDLTRFSKPATQPPIGKKYLVFFSGDEYYAISSKKVIEVAPTLPVTVLPNAPEWLLGIANLRGEVVSVVNLLAVLQTKISKPVPKPKFIILRSPIFKSGVAFTADRISEIVNLPDEKVEFNDAVKPPSVFGKVVHKARALNLIDTEKLLASLKF